MSTNKYELDAQIREDIGKGASRRLRHANKVPGIIYGGDKPPVSLTLEHNKVIQAVANESFYSRILTLKVGTQSEKVILKAMQRHPAKPRVTHMDFLRVRADQKLQMNIPLHFIGEDKAPGVKEGGVFAHQMSDVEISCLPENLPEYLEIDVSNMQLNDTIHLTDIQLPKGAELVALMHGVEGHDLPVVSLHIPRMVEEEPTTAPVNNPEVEATALKGDKDKAEGGDKKA